MWVRSRGIVVAVVLLAGLLSGGPHLVDADTIMVRLQPSHAVGNVGGTVVVTVLIDDVANLGAFEFHLGYNPAVLQATDAQLQAFLTSSGRTPVPLGPALKDGEIRFAAASYGTAAGPDGSGALAQVTFQVVGSGTSVLTFNRIVVTDTAAQLLPASATGGTFATEELPRSPIYLPLVRR